MKKVIYFSLLSLFFIYIGINATLYSAEYEYSTSVPTRVLELQELVEQLSSERSPGQAFSSDLPVRDARFTTLREFHSILHEAVNIHSQQRNAGFVPHPITMFGEPDGVIRDKFFIGFASEEYFSMIDFISEFTGIEIDMFEVTTIAPIPELGSLGVVGRPLQIEVEIIDISIKAIK